MRLLIALLLAAAPAAAQTSAAAHFQAGSFAQAATAGRAEKTVPGLIIAGRSLSTIAAFQTPEKDKARDLLRLAEVDFDSALAIQPNNRDALLQKAIAIGYRAKLDRSPGLAKLSRRNFEAILKRYPNDALALAAMGGWHGESVATLGRFLAGTALGAKESESTRFFDKALAAPGADPLVPIFYASTLMALSADHAPKARALLMRSLKTQPSDGFEALVQRNGRTVLAQLDKGDLAGARQTAARLAPLGTVR
jgi:Tfp pilus assembly protein PilF